MASMSDGHQLVVASGNAAGVCASSARAETAVELCKECISWATEEKRIFLRQVRSQIRVILLIVVRKKCDSNQYVLF